ncbi:cytochrome b561 [Aminobacter aminovorans]|jgi:cytochrome b561|uniref:Cytochrome b561 homolog 2 n=1 Tax=Aminobacter aminovorans TaxID=83263 RepID=A0A380WGJ2_AMIAI|nr:cytochrome b561 [Aminobacter aminovorans]SUU87472.1 Cytochrome b561 homolog 2 [Aminobacter aminovorans]
MLRNTDTRYGWAAIVLHWLIAALFIGQFALGLVMVRIASQRTAFELIQLHKSFGFLLLGLVLVRIGWWLGSKSPELPDEVDPLERKAAPIVHLLLYAAQLVVPLSGWVLVSVSVLEIPSVPFNLFVLPHLPFQVSEQAENFWIFGHRWLAYAGGALVLLHILAALRHHFWLRDVVLVRMISPFFASRARKPE